MSRVYRVALMAVVFISNLASAQYLPSTLLWKISGNGLSKPSYLYGTMHLTDERIFNLGDSLYSAIEKSEGFAIEIDPDDFTPFIIDEAKKGILQKQRLKDMMSDKDFKRYSKALSKRIGKDADDITTEDVLKQKNKWIEESYRTGKMKTFLDAYLFDVARREGKWTGGVEDMQDQEDLIDYLVDGSDVEQLANEDESKKSSSKETALEQMIKLYVAGDLNGIEFQSRLYDSLTYDKMLTHRNKKMAMRMDSLGRIRSMVFAVGAAHLPGNDGLIALLKAKGFTVSPVFSSAKRKPSDYKVPEIALPWHEVRDESDFYSASMPGKAGDMTLYGIMDMKMYFDVFSSTLYMTSAVNTPYSADIADSLLGVMAKYYFSVPSYQKGKAITINNVPGREFSYNKEKYSHGYLLYKDGVMYIALAMTMRPKDDTAEKSMNRFLSSFAIHDVPKGGEAHYISYADTGKAYSVEVPAQPKPGGDMGGKEADKSISSDLNVVVDPQSGNYFFFGSNEARPGYFIPNDSTLLYSIREKQQDKVESYTTDTAYFKDGNRVLELSGILKAAPVMMKVHYEFRGNRWYALVAMYDPKKESPVVDHFFSSFKMLDYAPHVWKSLTSTDNTFTTWLPGSIEKMMISDSGSIHPSYKYEAFDSSRANDYSVISEEFSKYYWQSSDTAMLNKLVKNNVDTGDTLLSQKPVINGRTHGIEMVVQEKGATNVKRKRLLLNGNKLYSLLAVQPGYDIYSADNNRFFNDFRFSKEASSDSLFISKAPLLIADLSDADSAVREGAINYLPGAPFTKTDLPLLHKALLQKYTDDDSAYRTTKERLKSAVIDIEDSSSYHFAKEQYPLANAKDKNIWLNIMLSYPTASHFNDIKNLLLQYPPKQKMEYFFVNKLTDSVSLTASIFPGLLPLLSDTAVAHSLLRIAAVLLDSGLLTVPVLQPYSQTILSISQQDYERVKKDPDDYDYTYYSLLDILAALNTPATNAAMQNWTTVKKNEYMKLYAASHLLANNQTVSSSVWQSLAADKSTRAQLYDTLVAHKKASLFPKEYLNQKSMAESLAYTEGSEDDEPSDITYLTQKVVSFKGRQARFFFYKLTYGEDEDATYSLACAGPFNTNTSDMSSKDAEGDVYYEEDFDPNNLPAQMDALLKQVEDGFEWDDK